MKNLFNEQLEVRKSANVWAVVVRKCWGSAPAYDSNGRHATFGTKSEAKEYMARNGYALV